MAKAKLKTTPERSKLMSRVRHSGTSLEIIVREILDKMKIQYNLNDKTLPGSPDMSSNNNRWAIYVQGCFWHFHAECPHGTIPGTNTRYWLKKLNENKQRDLLNYRRLRRMGYSVLIVWECELSEDRVSVERKIESFLTKLGLTEKNVSQRGTSFA